MKTLYTRTDAMEDADHMKPRKHVKTILLLIVLLVYLVYGPRYPFIVVYYYIMSFLFEYIYIYFGYNSIVNILLYISLLVVLFILIYILLNPKRYKANTKSINTLRNNVTNPMGKYIKNSIISLFLIFLLLEFLLPPILLSPIEKKMATFVGAVQQMCGGNVSCAVKEVTYYVGSNVNPSYHKPQSVFKIDAMLSPTDSLVIQMLGFSQAHVILWQGWGSCGEYAIVTEYLLHRLGYDVRLAEFTDIDHTWAEVFVNGTWYIVDPWYIGLYYKDKYLVPASSLAQLDKFSGYHGVLCTYLNGTEVDCTSDHGYRR